MNPLSPKANVSKGATLLYLSLLIGGSPFYLTAICTLIVSQLGRFVKRFLKFLSKDFFYSVRPSPLASCGLLLTSLTLYHTSGGLSMGFLSFFKKLFEVPNCGWRLTLSPRTTMGLPHISWVRSYLPLTLQIIAHLPTECNR